MRSTLQTQKTERFSTVNLSSLRLDVTYRSTYSRGVNAHRTQSMGYAHLALFALLLTVAAVSDTSLEAFEFVNEVTRSLASNG